MAKGSDNPFPSVLAVEGGTPASPSSGNQRLFIDSADHKVKRVNSGGTVTTVENLVSQGTRLIRATDLSLTSGGGAVPFSSAAFDQGGLWTSGAPTKLTIVTTGTYLIGGGASINNSGNPNRFVLSISKNGSEVPGSRHDTIPTAGATNSHFWGGSVSILDAPTAGDYYELSIYVDATTLFDHNAIGLWAVRLA